jgi:hypothetical protein
MAHDLVVSKGQMHSWFGMDLSSAPFTHHGGNQALLIIPYLVLIGMAIFLQYYQMKQMNSRNPQAAAANPQMQTMQKFFPIIFGVIYLRVPAGATIYMVVSSAMRIATQEVMFRTGYVTPVAAEREIAGGSKASPEVGKAPSKPAPKPAAKPAAKPPARKPTVTDGTGIAAAKGTTPPKRPAGSNGNRAPNGKAPATGNRASNGKKAPEAEQEPAPKSHPRSRSKRTRRAR